MKRILAAACLVPALCLTAGCSGTADDDLNAWMAEQKAMAKPRVVPISPPKQFTPAQYRQTAATDPFSPEKLTQALQRDTTGRPEVNTALLAPEMARRKEPLEAFPLDALSMVGSLQKEGRPVALVRVGALLYQVRVGEHVGQNYGRVMAINETETRIREVVQDPGGDWVERKTSLQLQEITK